MNNLLGKAGLLAMVVAMAPGVQALPAGLSDITIYDGDGYLGAGNSPAGVGEDQETEPGMINSQIWDLEAFVVEDGTKNFGMIGGFNFFDTSESGPYYSSNEKDFRSGDIFIDLDGDHIAGNAQANDGNGHMTVENTFGYDLVVDIDWTDGSYNIFELDANSQTIIPWYDANYGSTPWKFKLNSDAPENQVASGNLGGNQMSDAVSGFQGGTHYVVGGLDLNFLNDDDFFLHFTMGCGNDNLMGHYVGASVPEPSSIMLLGLGLVGLGVLRRKA